MKTCHKGGLKRLSLGLCAFFLLTTTLLTVSHELYAQGPITQVDIKNPVEADEVCDFHFKTLQAALNNCELPEFAIIVVDPGTYDEGRLDVDVKGLTIRSSDTAQRTKINGCFNITAQKIILQGFDINVDPDHASNTNCSHGITVEDRDVELLDNIIHEASQNAVEVMGFSDGLVMSNNHLFNNTASGVYVRGDSDGIRLTQNRIRSNGASGIVFEGNSDRFNISDNEIELNGGEGLLILGADGGQVTNNSIEANNIDGIKLDKSNENVIVDNTINANGQFGISLVGSDNNEVRANDLSSNRGGGVKLSGNGVAAQRNTIENNQVIGNSAGGSGILLEGDVTGSIILGNTIHRNSIGIRLSLNLDSPGPGQPSNNTFDSNDIQDSDDNGIQVEASLGLNAFLSNTLTNNNGVAIYITGGSGNDEFATNTIEGNGGDGIRIEGSDRNTLRENTVSFNGGSNGNSTSIDDGGAIVIANAASTSVRRNTLQDGEGNGILMQDARDTKIFDNRIERFQQDGIKGLRVINLLLEDNTIQNNRERGISFTDCDNNANSDGSADLDDNAVDLQGNHISGNTLGGIYLDDCINPHLQMNNITDNLRFGLWVDNVPTNTEVEARRNWWGDPKGPAGVFEGSGNAVIIANLQGGNSFQLENDQVLSSVMPWLTDLPDQQIESSVSGYVLRDFGPGKVELDASDHAHARVSFFNVEQEERGIAILARYANPLPTETSVNQPSELTGAVKTISILTNGFGSGTAIVDIEYDEAELAEGTDKSTLRLHYWDGSAWQELAGKSLEDVNLVEGEIAVDLLRDVAIISIAPQQ